MGEGVDRADWVCASLGDICVIKDGQRVPVNRRSREARVQGKISGELFRYFGATGQVGWIDDFLFDGLHVLLGEDGAPFYDIAKTKAYVVSGKYWVNNHAHVLRVLIEPHLLCHYLNQFDFHGYVTGTTRLKLNQNAMRGIPVDIPPLVEQRAIVAKIEALFSELDKGVEQLETLKGQLKRYRQSVLKAAFEGKLTAEWRAERARPFVQNSEQLKVAEASETYGTEKPKGWTCVRTGQLTEFVTSGSRGWSKYCGSTGALFIRSQDINRDTLALESVTRVNPPGGAEGNRTRVKTGDILLTITGANVGKCACVDREIPDAYVSQHVALLRLQDTVLASYLHWVFLSDAFVRGQLHRVAYGAGKPGLNLENVKDALIPLAPLPEQHQIVAEIEARFSALDQLEQTVEAGLKQAEALRQSILKKAFEGRLLSASERAAVRADPAYEPAFKLLERIRAERAAQSGQGGQRGRAPKKRPVSTASTPSTVSTPPTPKRRARP